MKQTRSEVGALSIPLALILALLLVGSATLIGVLHSWHQRARTQLRLDRCVGAAALEFKGRLQQVQALNRSIETLRVALAAATLSPEAQAPLRAALELAAARQLAHLAQWKARQALWFSDSACEEATDRASPLPSLPFQTQPPDGIGAKPMLWSYRGSEDTRSTTQFNFIRIHHPRIGSARVEGGTQSDLWKAKWAAPITLGPGSS